MAEGKALSSDNEESDEEQHQRDPIQVTIETCGVQKTPKHEQL